METRETTPDLGWVFVMGYENLPGNPHPYRAICD
jgi:hypothetical protein